MTASGRIPTLVTVALAALLVSRLAAAEALDDPACNQLKNEQERLAAEGLKTDMLRGPEWAKSNLPQAKLDQIKHLMEVEEQLLFRCPVAAKPAPLESGPGAPQPGKSDKADATGDPAAQKPVKKKARAKKKKANEAAASGDLLDGLSLPDLSGDTSAAKPADDVPATKAQKKKKAKAKKEPVNDAFVPPPAAGNAFVDGEADPVPQPPPQTGGKPPVP